MNRFTTFCQPSLNQIAHLALCAPLLLLPACGTISSSSKDPTFSNLQGPQSNTPPAPQNNPQSPQPPQISRTGKLPNVIGQPLKLQTPPSLLQSHAFVRAVNLAQISTLNPEAIALFSSGSERLDGDTRLIFATHGYAISILSENQVARLAALLAQSASDALTSQGPLPGVNPVTLTSTPITPNSGWLDLASTTTTTSTIIRMPDGIAQLPPGSLRLYARCWPIPGEQTDNVTGTFTAAMALEFVPVLQSANPKDISLAALSNNSTLGQSPPGSVAELQSKGLVLSRAMLQISLTNTAKGDSIVLLPLIEELTDSFVRTNRANRTARGPDLGQDAAMAIGQRLLQSPSGKGVIMVVVSAAVPDRFKLLP